MNFESINCNGCPYKDGLHLADEFQKIRNSPIPPEINGSKTLLVFQSPGLDEWRTGKPISSKNSRSTAHKIDSAFSLINKTREDFDITNVVQCYTGKLPDNGATKPRDKSVSPLALNICALNLQRLIKNNNYENLIVFGKVAKYSVENYIPIEKLFANFSKHPSARGVSIESIAILLKDK